MNDTNKHQIDHQEIGQLSALFLSCLIIRSGAVQNFHCRMIAELALKKGA
jgi:hypothetical protein